MGNPNGENLGHNIRKTADNAPKTQYRGYKNYTTDPQKAKHAKLPAMKAPSYAGPVCGIILGFGVGLSTAMGLFFMMLMGAATSEGMAAVFYAGAVALGIMAVAGLALGSLGIGRFAKIKRFKKYLKAIGKKEYCNISVLAGSVGKTDRQVLKDVKYMIANRWFPQGHMDKSGTCLMLTDRMYGQYMALEEKKHKEIETTEKTPEKNPQEKEKEKGKDLKKLPEEVRKVVEKGEFYLKRIRACNDEIQGEEISAKINRIEILVDKIFDRIEQKPKNIPDIRKMMEYYLPTTVKLLETYAEFDAQPAGGENIKTAKKEIEETLDTLNVAFEKLLDSLFQDTAWDVSSDISVLNTMLAQEGLTDDGLKNN